MFLSPVLRLLSRLQLAPERTPGPARLPAVRPRAIALQALHKVAAAKAVTLHQEWPLPNRPPPRLQPAATSSANKLSPSKASRSRSSGPSSLRSRHPFRRHLQSRHRYSSLLLRLRTNTVRPQSRAQSNLHRRKSVV